MKNFISDCLIYSYIILSTLIVHQNCENHKPESASPTITYNYLSVIISKSNTTIQVIHASKERHSGLYECNINGGKIYQKIGIDVVVLDNVLVIKSSQINGQIRNCLDKYRINLNSITNSESYKCITKYVNCVNDVTIENVIPDAKCYIYILTLKQIDITGYFRTGETISLQAKKSHIISTKPNNFEWQKITDNQEIIVQQNNTKIHLTETNMTRMLIIKNLTFEDTGNYTLISRMNDSIKTLNYEIIVKGKPILHLNNIYTEKNKKLKIECKSDAFPLPKFKWEYLPCGIVQLNWSQNCNDSRKIYIEENYTSNPDFIFELKIIKQSQFQQISQLLFNVTEFGYIKCLAENEYGKSEIEVNIDIGDIREPFSITESNKLDNLHIGNKITLECAVLITKFEKDIYWKRNNEIIQNTSDIEVLTSQTNFSYRKVLNFIITSQNQGKYKCVVRPIGSNETTSQTFEVEVHEYYWWHYILAAVIFLLIISIIILIIRIRKEKMKCKELKKLGLENFQKGNIESFNPRISIEAQSELLPYDNKFEFAEKRLKLGKILGYGAFGLVREGIAKNIIPGESETTVAVKMAKNDSIESIKTLASELKIMIYLGKHLNIVNLLGAVTQNISKHELMVIVEFCEYGNIKKYLMANRNNFINQIVPKSNKINFDIINPIRIKNIDKLTANNSNDYIAESNSSIVSTETDITNTTTSSLDYSNQRTLSTLDLIIWSYQIARGMVYLTSRNVLHGDLAARNILLCNDNIIKICDFGLAKSMYNQNTYQKKSETRLPLKWLAIESLEYNTFSTQSDVWSFGITLWEIFSLGRIPYPGMQANLLLLKKLQDGYRMEKPEFSNQELYDIILDCWNAVPEERPEFSVLENRLEKMLHKDQISQYITMNEPYLRENSIYQNSKSLKDYYNLINFPEIYANKSSNNLRNDKISTGYLPMKSIKNSFRKNIISKKINNRESLKTKKFEKNLIAEEILQKTRRIL